MRTHALILVLIFAGFSFIGQMISGQHVHMIESTSLLIEWDSPTTEVQTTDYRLWCDEKLVTNFVKIELASTNNQNGLTTLSVLVPDAVAHTARVCRIIAYNDVGETQSDTFTMIAHRHHSFIIK